MFDGVSSCSAAISKTATIVDTGAVAFESFAACADVAVMSAGEVGSNGMKIFVSISSFICRTAASEEGDREG